MEKNEMEYISKDDITALIESYKDRIALNIPEILRDINELETKKIGGRSEERPQGEWIDYDTFYKCPDCGYLLEKYCPQCQNEVILPTGGR